jgi:hypothetical protein
MGMGIRILRGAGAFGLKRRNLAGRRRRMAM